MGTWPSRLREYGIWDTEILSWVPQDSEPRITTLARASSVCKAQTRRLFKGRPTSTNPQLSDGNKNLVLGSRWVFDTITDWPTDRRSWHNFEFEPQHNLTLTLWLTSLQRYPQNENQNRYRHIKICLLCTGVALHVSTLPKSSSGESQEYQAKFLNWVTLIWIHILKFFIVNAPL
jgi:hypothetical protein